MSLYDLMRCARCGHARHEHATIDTKDGKRRVHCRRCDCPEWVEPDENGAYDPPRVPPRAHLRKVEARLARLAAMDAELDAEIAERLPRRLRRAFNDRAVLREQVLGTDVPRLLDALMGREANAR